MVLSVDQQSSASAIAGGARRRPNRRRPARHDPRQSHTGRHQNSSVPASRPQWTDRASGLYLPAVSVPSGSTVERQSPLAGELESAVQRRLLQCSFHETGPRLRRPSPSLARAKHHAVQPDREIRLGTGHRSDGCPHRARCTASAPCTLTLAASGFNRPRSENCTSCPSANSIVSQRGSTAYSRIRDPSCADTAPIQWKRERRTPHARPSRSH